MVRNALVPAGILAVGVGISLIIYLHPLRSADSISLLRETDAHRMGDEDAEITIVEFSDFECPYCAQLHPILKRIVLESKGNVKWEFRHFPLDIHRNADEAALAAECVAELKGDAVFWSYADSLFENQRSLSSEFFYNKAEELGIEKDVFLDCIGDESILQRVLTDSETARALGGNGTPFSVILYSDGSTHPVSGALPHEYWKSLVENK